MTDVRLSAGTWLALEKASGPTAGRLCGHPVAPTPRVWDVVVRSPARTHWTLRRPRAGADPFRARGDLRRRGRHEAQSWGRPDPLRMWPHPGGASRGKLGDHPERLLGFHICVRATLERSSHENADPLLLEGGHGLVEIVHLELDMVEALAFLLQEFFVDARTLHRLHQLPTDIAT